MADSRMINVNEGPDELVAEVRTVQAEFADLGRATEFEREVADSLDEGELAAAAREEAKHKVAFVDARQQTSPALMVTHRENLSRGMVSEIVLPLVEKLGARLERWHIMGERLDQLEVWARWTASRMRKQDAHSSVPELPAVREMKDQVERLRTEYMALEAEDTASQDPEILELVATRNQYNTMSERLAQGIPSYRGFFPYIILAIMIVGFDFLANVGILRFLSSNIDTALYYGGVVAASLGMACHFGGRRAKRRQRFTQHGTESATGRLQFRDVFGGPSSLDRWAVVILTLVALGGVIGPRLLVMGGGDFASVWSALWEWVVGLLSLDSGVAQEQTPTEGSPFRLGEESVTTGPSADVDAVFGLVEFGLLFLVNLFLFWAGLVNSFHHHESLPGHQALQDRLVRLRNRVEGRKKKLRDETAELEYRMSTYTGSRRWQALKLEEAEQILAALRNAHRRFDLSVDARVAARHGEAAVVVYGQALVESLQQHLRTRGLNDNPGVYSAPAEAQGMTGTPTLVCNLREYGLGPRPNLAELLIELLRDRTQIPRMVRMMEECQRRFRDRETLPAPECEGEAAANEEQNPPSEDPSDLSTSGNQGNNTQTRTRQSSTASDSRRDKSKQEEE